MIKKNVKNLDLFGWEGVKKGCNSLSSVREAKTVSDGLFVKYTHRISKYTNLPISTLTLKYSLH